MCSHVNLLLNMLNTNIKHCREKGICYQSNFNQQVITNHTENTGTPWTASVAIYAKKFAKLQLTHLYQRQSNNKEFKVEKLLRTENCCIQIFGHYNLLYFMVTYFDRKCQCNYHNTSKIRNYSLGQ